MTKAYEFHPYSEIFPMMDDESAEFAALVEDIKEHGLREPIVVYEGRTLDGRNRERACRRLGKKTEMILYEGNDPLGFVLSRNVHRRHLNEGQRAMVAAKLANLELGANQHTEGEGVSIETASRLLNVSRSSVNRALKVLRQGDPALVESVQQGKVSVTAGAALTTKKTVKSKRKTIPVEKRIEALVNYLGRIVEGCERTVDDDDLDELLTAMSGDQKDDAKQRVEMAQTSLNALYGRLGGDTYVAIVDTLLEELESMDQGAREAAAERVKEMLEEMLSSMRDDDSVDDDSLEPMA
jgi:ParB-like chromosome segregation protein Spo0J